MADHDYFDDLLNTLPEAYQALARQGMYGDFFTFYLCDAVLKLNGKGGQPVLREGRRPALAGGAHRNEVLFRTQFDGHRRGRCRG